MSEAATEIYAGIMSGTSLDGVDVVLADFADGPQLLASAYLPYSADLRAALLALNTPGHDELRRSQELAVALAEYYAQAVHIAQDKTGLAAEQIRAIGCHGQTVRHRPEKGYSLQLNHPARLAELTGIDVVADFRNRDIAAGGQGAPLVPAFHHHVLASPTEHRAVLNLGGIANVSNLPLTGAVIGFDTGPANALLDGWAAQHLGQPYDADGAWGRQGMILTGLLTRWLAHPFFAEKPPKSCGREEFSLEWLQHTLTGAESAQDVQTSLTELTAISAARAIDAWCGRPSKVLLCGGGAHNTFLRERLQAHLPQAGVVTTDAYGVPGDLLEAFAFAWLARCALRRESGNLPEVTGARGPRVLGALYPR